MTTDQVLVVVVMKMSGDKKTGVNVMVVLADGSKLPSYVILNHKNA
jgi:hypothetical protein